MNENIWTEMMLIRLIFLLTNLIFSVTSLIFLLIAPLVNYITAVEKTVEVLIKI